LSDDTERDLSNFLNLRNLDQISIRIYYLYYRLIDVLREEQISTFNYSYNTITAVVGGFMGILSLLTFVQNLDDIYKGGAIIATIIVIVVLVWYKGRTKPKKVDYENFTEQVTFAINLDQIFKQANQCLMLINLLKKHENDSEIKDFLSDSYDILQDSLNYVEKLYKDMKKADTFDNDLKSLHINEKYIDRRLKFGKSVLEKSATLISN